MAKASKMHVIEALRTTLDEAVAMAADSVGFLRSNDLRVFFDAEHFFDGYRANPEFTLRVLRAAEEAGAEALVLCDTNGGTLPTRSSGSSPSVGRLRVPGRRALPQRQGLCGGQLHRRRPAGATHVQGASTATGSAPATRICPPPSPTSRSSSTCAPSQPTASNGSRPVSHHIAELVNITPNPQQPYVGAAVFAHKAGLHTTAIARRSDAYEHIPPDLVGNGTRFVVSEMAGRSTLAIKAEELGLELDSEAMASVLDTLKRLEYAGYHFEVADGSLELLLRNATGWEPGVLRGGVVPGHRRPHQSEPSTEATVKIRVGNERMVATAEGNGPVNALDGAVRGAIGPTSRRCRGPSRRLPGAGAGLGQGNLTDNISS